jgi:hypothetical protein
MAEK